jgi:hypothetical protein
MRQLIDKPGKNCFLKNDTTDVVLGQKNENNSGKNCLRVQGRRWSNVGQNGTDICPKLVKMKLIFA